MNTQPIDFMKKIVPLIGETSNRIFETLAEWEGALKEFRQTDDQSL